MAKQYQLQKNLNVKAKKNNQDVGYIQIFAGAICTEESRSTSGGNDQVNIVFSTDHVAHGTVTFEVDSTGLSDFFIEIAGAQP
jgi:hypothetical protein